MTTTQLDTERLAKVLNWSLLKANHEPNDEGRMCVMDAVAYVAGEPWSDHPQCACPVITAFLVAWNDGLPTDADRDRILKPLISQIVGSRSTPDVAERRAYVALDWLVRVSTPKWLDLLPELAVHAKALRDLEEVADMAGAAAAGHIVRGAAEAARAALQPTVEWLQASALDLVARMLEVRPQVGGGV